eukprot:5370580-Pleurochrysis_carterae.AAC.2
MTSSPRYRRSALKNAAKEHMRPQRARVLTLKLVFIAGSPRTDVLEDLVRMSQLPMLRSTFDETNERRFWNKAKQRNLTPVPLGHFSDISRVQQRL